MADYTIYTVIFPSVWELTEFKIRTKIPWETLDINHLSVTAKLTQEQLLVVKELGGTQSVSKEPS